MHPSQPHEPAAASDEANFGVLPGESGGAPFEAPISAADRDAHEADVARIEQYDVDGDGDVSAIEAVRGELGLLDAALEARGDGDGIVGGIARQLHRIVDRLDNDRTTPGTASDTSSTADAQ